MEMARKIRERQNQLLVMINSTFDEIVREVEQLGREESGYEEQYESMYPITNTTGFKGKKVIAVKFGENRIITPTWKIVVETILKEVIKDEVMKERIMLLRDRLLGRVRKRISSSSDNMRSPIELCDNLYIETHYDTETLMNLLITILDEIRYDYTQINVVIKN